jgi:medium-chain acyl-[acyl-carrier-protein] hydrolase
MSRSDAVWLDVPCTRPRARLRLFCFPYAGGNASTFRNWPAHLPEDIEVCAVELPGRGRRFVEPPINNMRKLTAAMLPAISARWDRPAALFGHSLGAVIAFDLAHQFHAKPPVHLFVSSCSAPNARPREAQFDHLSDEQIMSAMARIGGISSELLANHEFMTIFLPILRSDIGLMRSFGPNARARLECPITCFGGTADPMLGPTELAGWRKETGGAFGIHLLPGDHFFLRSAEDQLLALLAAILADEVT